MTAQALSLSEPDADGARTLGIHIADVASRVPETSPLYAWALARGSSAYVYRVEISAQRVAAPPRLPRGYSMATGRGAAAAKTWIFRGDGSRRRRG